MNPREVVETFYESMSRGDVAAALAVLDPSVEWTEAETVPYHSGTWIGPEAVRVKLIEPLGRDWDSFAVSASSYVVDGPAVVAFGTYSGVFKATGGSLSAPFAHRWNVVNGKAKSFRQYTDTALVLRAVQHA
jgi:ketosteroid isomerase-like protein